MNALVVGGSGLVGAALVRTLRATGATAVPTYHARSIPGGRALDVREPDAVRHLVAEVRPETIFVAVIPPGGVDVCEARPAEARAFQVDGTAAIAAAATEAGASVVYYSTDYLFDGREGPYDEEATPAPLNVYGRTKLEAETVLTRVAPGALIVRTTTVFGWSRTSRNFAMQVWERLSAGTPMRVPDDQWCNPTLADYLAEATVRLVERGAHGVFNVVGSTWTVRSEFGRALAASLDLDAALIVPTATAALGQGASRPLRAGLLAAKVERTLGERPPDLAESLARFRARFRDEARAS